MRLGTVTMTSLENAPTMDWKNGCKVHHFYNGLTRTTRTLLDTSARCALMSKSANEAYKLLEDMALNNYQWSSERATPKKMSGVHMNWMFSTT